VRRRAAGIALLIALGALGCKKKQQRPDPEIYYPVPSFAMVDHRGQPFTRDDLLGKVSIADFIFTRCDTICPVITLRMRHVQEKTDPAVQLLSFSVDPAYDTPARLAEYAGRAGADQSRWRFITGDPAEMLALVEGGFRVPMEPAPPSAIDGGAPQMLHTDYFVLIDGAGRIRGYYQSSDRDRIAALLADTTLLLRK
jgi:protein SCO1/2